MSATNVVVANDNSLTCDTPAGVPSATVDVGITNSNGSYALVGGFFYHPVPSLTAVAPVQGTGLGGTAVTLTGTGFLDFGAGTNQVTFGGTNATSVVVVSDTTITCVTPVGTPGTTVDVAVTNVNGSDTLSSGYSYVPPPTLAG